MSTHKRTFTVNGVDIADRFRTTNLSVLRSLSPTVSNCRGK